MLKIGMPFPEFSLEDQDGATVTLADLKDGKSIVYFYPKDDTPGCTAEACELNERLPNFNGARVFGVSPDSPKSHREFANKYDLRFTLLADPEHKLSEACGVYQDGETMGKRSVGVVRTTFLLDGNGIILHIWEKVTPRDHAQEILDWLTQS